MSAQPPGPVEGREAAEGDPRLGVLSPGRGSLPGMVPRLGLWMSQPSLDACPTSCLAALPRDCLCSFDRQASCWSLQPRRWGPPLISSPTLQLGGSRARPSPHPPKHPLSPPQLVLQEKRHGRLPQSFPPATAIHGLRPIEGHGWEARGVKNSGDQACPSVTKPGEDSVEGSQANPLLSSWRVPPAPFQILAASALDQQLTLPSLREQAASAACRSMQEPAA